MKLCTLGIGLVAMGTCGLAAWAQSADPDVKDIGMGRRAIYLQTTPSSAAFQHYDFNVGVGTRQPGGVINSAQVIGPGPSVIGNGVALTGHPNGYDYQSGTYATLGAFNTAFPLAGSYQVSLDTSGSSNPDYTIEYLWPSGATSTFPTTLPTLTALGGYWSGGSLYLDVTQNQSFSWDYADYGSGGVTDVDGATLEIEQGTSGTVFDFSAIGVPSTGTTMNAGTLTVGQTYTGILAFGRIVDDGVNNPGTSPSAGIVGADSVAYYLNATRFTIVAIPEPSTYALFALGLGLMTLPWLRRRLAR